MKFYIYKDKKQQFRWRLVAKNGRIIAVAGESFTRKENCMKSIATLCLAYAAPVVDLTLK